MKSQQKTAGSSPKPIPQVISFQDPLPKARHYRPQADRILSGDLVITGDDGSRRTFRAGDAFVPPAGFTGTWEIIEPARKLYAYYE